MSLEQLYQQIILEHAKLRTGSGLAETPVPSGASSGQSHQLNPVCGDEITVRVAVSDGKVAQLRWDGAGCSIRSQAQRKPRRSCRGQVRMPR